MSNKINLDWIEDFRNRKFVINCKTEEEAVQLINILYDNGMKWNGFKNTSWKVYEEKTCYSFNFSGVYEYITYNDLRSNITLNKTIKNFSDLIKPNSINPRATTKNIKHIIKDNTTIVLVYNQDSTYSKGVAKCNTEIGDKFNEYEGFRIAYARACGKSDEEIFGEVEGVPGTLEEQPMYEKFNSSHWKDFLDDKIAVNCRTEEDAKEFLRICDSMGLRWNYDYYESKRTLTNCTFFDWFLSDTFYMCKNSNLMFDIKQNHYKIVIFQKI